MLSERQRRCACSATAPRDDGYKDIDDAFFGDAPGVPEFESEPGDRSPDLTEKIGETFGWVLTTPDLPDVLADERRMNELRANRPDSAAMTDANSIDYTGDTSTSTSEACSPNTSSSASWPPADRHHHRGVRSRRTARRHLKLLAGWATSSRRRRRWRCGSSAGVAALADLHCFDEGAAGLDARLREGRRRPPRFNADFADFLLPSALGAQTSGRPIADLGDRPDLALAAIDRMRLSPASSRPQAQRRTGRRTRAPRRRDRGHGRRRPRDPRPVPGRAQLGHRVHARPRAHQNQLHQARP